MKTYYSKYNKDAYIRMRKDFNAKKDDFLRLYLLLIYGFNHMIRFNSKGDFNLPVGNVDFNNNVYQALKNYLEFVGEHEIEFFNMDYRSFLEKMKFGITNLITHKGKVNQRFLDWSKKYCAYNVKSNYISFNDNTIKADSQEVFVTNVYYHMKIRF